MVHRNPGLRDDEKQWRWGVGASGGRKYLSIGYSRGKEDGLSGERD